MLCGIRGEEAGLYSGGGASDSTSLDVLMGFDESQLLKGSRMLPRGEVNRQITALKTNISTLASQTGQVDRLDRSNT